jgi:hypothetical protein
MKYDEQKPYDFSLFAQRINGKDTTLTLLAETYARFNIRIDLNQSLVIRHNRTGRLFYRDGSIFLREYEPDQFDIQFHQPYTTQYRETVRYRTDHDIFYFKNSDAPLAIGITNHGNDTIKFNSFKCSCLVGEKQMFEIPPHVTIHYSMQKACEFTGEKKGMAVFGTENYPEPITFSFIFKDELLPTKPKLH